MPTKEEQLKQTIRNMKATAAANRKKNLKLQKFIVKISR